MCINVLVYLIFTTMPTRCQGNLRFTMDGRSRTLKIVPHIYLIVIPFTWCNPKSPKRKNIREVIDLSSQYFRMKASSIFSTIATAMTVMTAVDGMPSAFVPFIFADERTIDHRTLQEQISNGTAKCYSTLDETNPNR